MFNDLLELSDNTNQLKKTIFLVNYSPPTVTPLFLLSSSSQHLLLWCWGSIK